MMRAGQMDDGADRALCRHDLTEALTAAIMAAEAHRRWTASPTADAPQQARAALNLLIEEAERMAAAARALLGDVSFG
ncbi:hypothetical protein [Sphingomonas crocodyli]|uniref:Uncharacterized protein n=1 Tax=Sphingomonas crocodyli TaxID=1979270 RepID=A0A437LZU3_9SPHN|nr:hypothetical protein [Sphingomonas crocodyli]RVT90948.1 hypothetical protein EOD43_15555 [Sphingomonas crocodyli]